MAGKERFGGDRGEFVGREKRKPKRRERYENLIYVSKMPCEFQKIVRSPFYIFAPLSCGRQFLNFLVHHVCSIIGHAKSRMRLKMSVDRKTKRAAMPNRLTHAHTHHTQIRKVPRFKQEIQVVQGGCSDSTGSLNFCRASSTHNSKRNSPASTRRTGTVLARPFETRGGCC